MNTFKAKEMIQRVRLLVLNPDGLSWSVAPTWRAVKNNSCELVSDFKISFTSKGIYLSIYCQLLWYIGKFPSSRETEARSKEFEANIGYIVRAYLNKRGNREKTKPRTISALCWTVLQTAAPYSHVVIIGWNQAGLLKMGHTPFSIGHSFVEVHWLHLHCFIGLSRMLIFFFFLTKSLKPECFAWSSSLCHGGP